MNKEFKELFEYELKSIINNNSNNLILPNDEDELEIRFGKLFMGNFNTNVGIEKFKNILNKIDKNGKTYLIIDWIHRPELLKVFNKKFHKLVRRQTIEKKFDIFENNININNYDHRKFVNIKNKEYFENELEMKIKDLSNLSNNEKNKEEEEYKKRLQYLNEGNTIYLSKSIVGDKKNRTQENLRFSHVIEHIFNVKEHNLNDISNIRIGNIPYSGIRLKKRYSTYINDVWRLDLTIVNKGKLRWMRGIDLDKEYEYQIEIEFDNQIYRKMEIKPSISNMMLSLNNLIQLISNELLDYNIDIQPLEPHTLEKKDLSLLTSIPYSVTDKADGERMFLFIDENIYLKNPKTQKFEYEIKNKDNFDNLKGTIIDGEFLKDMKSFFAFDIMLFKSEDIRKYNLTKRLEYLNIILKDLNKLLIDFKISSKKFYFDNIFNKAKKLWLSKDNIFPYKLDGLIFTPINEPYSINNKIPIFKWKDKHSIDVRVEYKNSFTYFHSYSRNTYEWPDSYNKNIKNKQLNLLNTLKNKNIDFFDIKHSRFVMNINKGQIFSDDKLLILKSNGNNSKYYLGIPDIVRFIPSTNEEIIPKYDIIEFEFDMNKKMWIPLRKRTFDKQKPNSYKSIESALIAILQNITIDDIAALQNTNNFVKTAEEYNLTKDNTIERLAFRNFHNYVKRFMITKSICYNNNKHKFLLDLGSGSGGDILKWISAGFTDILAVEPAIIRGHEFINRLIKLGFIESNNRFTLKINKKTKKLYNPPINITIIIGDASKNLQSGEAGANNEESKKLLQFFKDKNFNGFDVISTMFVIHYMFIDSNMQKNKNKFENYMKNITDNLKPEGIFMGTYMDGIKINKLINNKNSYSFLHDNNHKFYEISYLNNYNDSISRTYNSFWNKNIQIMNIYNKLWGDTIIPEPKIYSNILYMLFKQFNIYSIINNTSFEDLYQNYLNSDLRKYKGKKILTQDEKNLSFLNNFFFCKFNKNISFTDLNNVCNPQIINNSLDELNKFNSLLKQLSINNVSNINDFYLKLYNFVNDKNNKPSKDNLQIIADFFQIKNTKQRINSYIKLML